MAQVLLNNGHQTVSVDNTSPDYQSYLKGGFVLGALPTSANSNPPAPTNGGSAGAAGTGGSSGGSGGNTPSGQQVWMVNPTTGQQIGTTTGNAAYQMLLQAGYKVASNVSGGAFGVGLNANGKLPDQATSVGNSGVLAGPTNTTVDNLGANNGTSSTSSSASFPGGGPGALDTNSQSPFGASQGQSQNNGPTSTTNQSQPPSSNSGGGNQVIGGQSPQFGNGESGASAPSSVSSVGSGSPTAPIAGGNLQSPGSILTNQIDVNSQHTVNNVSGFDSSQLPKEWQSAPNKSIIKGADGRLYAKDQNGNVTYIPTLGMNSGGTPQPNYAPNSLYGLIHDQGYKDSRAPVVPPLSVDMSGSISGSELKSALSPQDSSELAAQTLGAKNDSDTSTTTQLMPSFQDSMAAFQKAKAAVDNIESKIANIKTEVYTSPNNAGASQDVLDETVARETAFMQPSLIAAQKDLDIATVPWQAAEQYYLTPHEVGIGGTLLMPNPSGDGSMVTVGTGQSYQGKMAASYVYDLAKQYPMVKFDPSTTSPTQAMADVAAWAQVQFMTKNTSISMGIDSSGNPLFYDSKGGIVAKMFGVDPATGQPTLRFNNGTTQNIAIPQTLQDSYNQSNTMFALTGGASSLMGGTSIPQLTPSDLGTGTPSPITPTISPGSPPVSGSAQPPQQTGSISYNSPQRIQQTLQSHGINPSIVKSFNGIPYIDTTVDRSRSGNASIEAASLIPGIKALNSQQIQSLQSLSGLQTQLISHVTNELLPASGGLKTAEHWMSNLTGIRFGANSSYNTWLLGAENSLKGAGISIGLPQPGQMISSIKDTLNSALHDITAQIGNILGQVTVKSPQGKTTLIPANQLDAALSAGGSIEGSMY